MRIGTRILRPEEIGLWQAEILQVSVYCGTPDNLIIMRKSVKRCRNEGIPFIIHPINYSLTDKETLPELEEMAEQTDGGLILHDERTPEGKRLEGEYEIRFRKSLEKLMTRCDVAFENSANTADIFWFWSRYANHIAVDFGHAEAAGIDSVAFATSMDEVNVGKVKFVHMHRRNGRMAGAADHQPLTPHCREITALRELLRKKDEIDIFLEIGDSDAVDGNLEILRNLREQMRRGFD